MHDPESWDLVPAVAAALRAAVAPAYAKLAAALPAGAVAYLEPTTGATSPTRPAGAWVPVVGRFAPGDLFAKRAGGVADVTAPFTDLLGMREGPVSHFLGGPAPVASALTGGALGASLGYGAGWLGEKLLPGRHFEKGKLRRSLSRLGLLAGVTPGVYQAVDNAASGQPWYAKRAGRDDGSPTRAWDAVADMTPFIHPAPFTAVLLQDPYTAAPLRAAAAGLVDAAAYARGGGPVSPFDLARVAAHAGGGYLSGLVVGKTLGALAGLRPEAQQALQRAGTWAGVLRGVLPLAFGR